MQTIIGFYIINSHWFRYSTRLPRLSSLIRQYSTSVVFCGKEQLRHLDLLIYVYHDWVDGDWLLISQSCSCMHPPSFCLANWKNLKDKASTMDSIEDVVIPRKIIKPVNLFICFRINVFALQIRIVGKETKGMHKKPEIAPDTALLYMCRCYKWLGRCHTLSIRTVSLNPGGK